jgi:homoaconitase/3-isopropylmalate dehydratase large subunit
MGDGGRVHLAAPAVVAASAILGRIASPTEVLRQAQDDRMLAVPA